MKIKITCRPRYNPWLKKYLNTKTFSKILAFGVLLNSMPISSLAGILSEDNRYETFEGDNITINNILEEDKVDVEIEGNTVVNLLGDITNVSSGNIITIENDGQRISFVQNSVQNNIQMVSFKNALVEPGKTYTLYFEIVKNTLNRDDGNTEVAKFNIVNHGYGVRGIHENQIGIQKAVLTQPDISTHDGKPYLEVHMQSVGELIVKDLMLLEGDWSNKEIPRYFKGVKSVGQDDENGHNIEISSKNKLINNLFNYNDLEIGTIYHHNGTNNNGFKDRWRSKSFIDIGDSKTITVKSDDKYIAQTLHFYDANKNFIERKVNLNNPKTEIIPDGTRYIRYVFRHSNEDGILPTLPLSGEQITITLDDDNIDYIDSQSNKIQISLNEPLRGLPNGIKDRIIKKNGQWYIERNCGEIVLDGSDDEKWVYESDWTGNCEEISRFNIAIPKQKYNSWSNLMYENKNYSINDSFNSLDYLIDTHSLGVEHFSGWDLGRFVLNIKTSRLSVENELGLKEWLLNNPIKLVYQLDKPIYEPIKIDLSVNLFEGTTHISTNSTIPANMKITVDRVINRATESVELAKINPTTENVSLARMWTNLLDDSIKKDELQSEINSIANIDDLQMELKSASANLDVYIKCENMLSMSLDTNQITFDDFSGIEDVEKTNAVNISINSSLPYQLNAYLPAEIQNTDKTKTMNKEILQLKESNESDYKEFANINEKVVLKDNCSSGNQLVHSIDIMLKGGVAHEKDVYKAVIKLEAEQK